ncbi:MAG: hypothetical protein NTZ67_06905 [Gammaproteobacteria bacterium]|nr:hypothetical protein [Gammaproteobacteria bacterium]
MKKIMITAAVCCALPLAGFAAADSGSAAPDSMTQSTTPAKIIISVKGSHSVIGYMANAQGNWVYGPKNQDTGHKFTWVRGSTNNVHFGWVPLSTKKPKGKRLLTNNMITIDPTQAVGTATVDITTAYCKTKMGKQLYVKAVAVTGGVDALIKPVNTNHCLVDA